MISIIINTKNEAKNLPNLLQSILQNSAFPKEIIVVDNHSTDGTLQKAKKILKNGKLKYQLLTAGPERSSQKNFGARKAIGKYLLFLDADMTIPHNLIKKLQSLVGKNIEAWIIKEISYGTDIWSQAVALERNCYQNNLLLEAPRLIKKSLFLQIGGFDENLVAAEDWDLYQRLKKKRSSIKQSNAAIFHHEPQGFINTLKKKWYYTKYIERYAIKHPQQFKKQAELKERLRPFWHNRRLLLCHPIKTLLFLCLKLIIFLRWKWSHYEKKKNSH